ncbi:glutaminyl-peptide cyclotransferase [Corynebacterium sanguinis]|uniref:glutaminyl-peptide cyclotransferase n=1 Tax=Corynebacterium sanguinis TaxID=2594913 RepID=UPI00223A72DE|nr:glutaminyl-peptide cyclotransferase [Corynebacterium sanguinis]MCT2287909.1 glutaminyl-peptide cyclotransferase [Corynebacterium sanguinis]
MHRHCLKAAAPLAALLLTPALTSCSPQLQEQPREQGVEKLTAVVEQRYDFDPSSFTQGLEVADDGTLYVGTGQVGSSRIYRTTLDGQVTASRDLDPAFFGEGITRTGDYLWQLTWQDGVALKRDAETLEELGRTTFEGEGWGVCARDGEVILSDGTAQLRRMDPETFAERERFTVSLGGAEVPRLNELECVGDEIYANVFLTTDIVRIDAATGDVTAVIDASSLPNNAAPDPDNVLNGIAHIPGTDEFYLAGKRWPDLYRVSFEPAAVG